MVRAGEQELTADGAIVLNTGTEPAVPPIRGLSGTPFWTNREAVAAEAVPESLIVLGAGAIGLELAQAFARFGSTVSVVELAEHILPLEEPEAARVLAEALTAEGIAPHTGVAAEQVGHDGTAFTVTLPGRELRAERLLVATGRATNLAGLGLATIGVDTDRPFVEPDERLRIADGVYAIGDITGKGAFTHVSMYQAAIVVADILGREGPPAEYHAVPRVTFTDPEVGAVGLTEAQARERGVEVRVATTEVPGTARGWLHKTGNEGVIKLVEDASRGVLVGTTSMGPHGGEVLGMLALAVHAEIPTPGSGR
ncbi:Pyridine nucleotide-disulphide oxidoreductase, dimerisation domain [Amycolatopsis arida]|uniref:Pyridine nucleotide-disulphide oxidoreductase, dimerisation domain n=1 Tax=Amycolatopsis arida TaxID=587909 RepID=A0A1I6AWB8_9PSEU|nr:NAD(P)/FAD-dependent oxidoreductase [Amycolatopsis arida]TDX85405.1 pyridine nucleotide-disulfide oxidoreductase [Amycolatopsis arida]SFQ72797.1 Pyridine nucleotide-disulphide oxidoreductase, dimerisation domain [Amycolatopsis arida]